MAVQGGKLIIFGAGEIATMARYYFEEDTNFSVDAFVVDDAYVREDSLEGLPIVPYSEAVKRFPAEQWSAHVALSYQKLNQLRQAKYEQMKNAGYALQNYVCSRIATWPSVSMGDNCFVLENQTLQPNVRLGNNVMLWSGNHIGHGSRIRDHAYLASHVVVSGHCDIGERCFLGVNATLKDFTIIGDDCFIAMDASVTRNLSPGSVALGAKSVLLDGKDSKAKRLISGYFGLSSPKR